MSVEHVLPIDLADRLTEGVTKPDVVVKRFETGGRMSRFWSEYNLATYRGRLIDMDFSSTDIINLKAFLDHIQLQARPFWLIEPYVEEHKSVRCGGLADGTQTTFIVPIREYISIYGIYENEAYISPPSYDIRASSNLVADDDTANAVEAIGDMVKEGAGGTISRDLGDSLDGPACFKRVQTAAANNGMKIAAQSLSGSTKYTFHAFVKGIGTFKIRIIQNDSGDETTLSTGITGSATVWQQETVTIITEAGTTAAEFQLIKVEAVTTTWFGACFGVAQGDNEKWFLPSVAPPLVEFASAPTEGGRVTASGNGKRMSRVALDSSGFSWSRRIVGHVYPQSFQATEVVER